jgi:hypothetical protein
MANRIDSTTVEVPTVLRDRLARRRVHPRQAMHEIIEDALDVLDDLEGPLGATLGKASFAAVP